MICINQANVEERNQLVQQMASIYRKAKQAIIYPGYLRRSPSPQVQSVISCKHYLRGGMIDPMSKWSIYSAVLAHPRSYARFCKVDSMQYWGRVWIIQEVLLAKDAVVMIANDLFQWMEFASFLLRVAKALCCGSPTIRPKLLALTLASVTKTLNEVPSISRQEKLNGWGFARIMNFFQTQQCSEIKDRFYGICGICDETRGMTVNYDEDEVSTMLQVASMLELEDVVSLLFVMQALSEALQVYFTLICVGCFRKASVQIQSEIWHQVERSGEACLDSLVFLVGSTDRPKEDVPVSHMGPSELYRCRECAQDCRALQARETLDCSYTIIARCATAICLQLKTKSKMGRSPLTISTDGNQLEN